MKNKLIRMKNILLGGILFWILFACNQKAGRNNNVTIAKKDTLELDSSFSREIGGDPLDIFLKNYVDSLNEYKPNISLPKFLENYYFDYDYSGILSPAHAPISLRKLIIDRVSNCRALIAIAGSDKPSYMKEPGKRNGIDVKFSNLSISELAKKQLRNLNCK
jgi:hypothetical protein